MHSTAALVFVVAAIVLAQCQPNWVTQYRDVRAQVMPTFVEGRGFKILFDSVLKISKDFDEFGDKNWHGYCDAVLMSNTARAFLPPRYRNLFGEESSKVREEAFAPQTISDITGKVNQQRRQLFSWQPSANADFFRR